MDHINLSEKKMHNYNYPTATKKYFYFKKLENDFDIKLEANSYYIIRFDGKGMTKDYKKTNHTTNGIFFNTMKETFKSFCSSKPNVLFGYSFSDEISVLIQGSSSEKSIRSRLEKILSLYSSELSVLFYKTALKNNLKLKRDSIFDARVLKIKKENIVHYFCSRQAFAICKYVLQLRDKYHINPQMIQTKDIIAELKKQRVNYFFLPPEHRYGLIYSPFKKVVPFEFENNIQLLGTIMKLENEFKK